MREDEYYEQVVKPLKSPHYFPTFVSPRVFEQLLVNFVRAGGLLDDVKKELFYGKRSPSLTPSNQESDFDISTFHPDIIHGLLGIITEATELAERLLAMGREPQQSTSHRANLIEEIGDLEWYVTLLCARLCIARSTARTANFNKLFVRYPGKFTQQAAVVRDISAETAAMDKVVGVKNEKPSDR